MTTVDQILAFATLAKSEEKFLEPICESLGYGRVMQIASELWLQKAEGLKTPGAGKLVGPHKAGTKPCPCLDLRAEVDLCDWCNGCGWLTKHVHDIASTDKRIVEERGNRYLR